MQKVFLMGLVLSLMLGCEAKGKESYQSAEIAKIPEASGICFSKKSHTLFVVEDEGKIYEISTEGKILRQKRLGDLDLEGIACDDAKGELLLAQEGEDDILIVGQKTLNLKKRINIKRKYHDRLILKKDKKHGLEGITLVDDFILLSNQSKKLGVKKDPSVMFKVEKSDKKKVTILELFEHGHIDISGLCYHDNTLFMVSDRENLLLKYDMKNKKVLATAKLPLASQEGIAFDDDGNLYIANDAGSILKYKRKKFGL